ncbi:MAG: AI-2E family transporter [Cellulosilyticaceae bacterium]
MNKYWDLKYLKITLYSITVIIIAILVYRLSSNTDNIMPSILNFWYTVTGICTPILYGLLIAYLMNPAMQFFERHLIKWISPSLSKHYKNIRILSIIMVYIILFSTIFFSIRFVIPEILENIKIFLANLNDYINEINSFLLGLEERIVDAFPYPEVQSVVSQTLDPSIISQYLNIASISQMLDQLITHFFNITGTLFNWIIGFVIAIYALMQKETFVNGSKRLTFAIMKPYVAKKIISIMSEAHNTISKFFTGKSLDSLIIGSLCFIGLSIMNNPYSLILSLIIGVSNMIPYFGPFIGAIPAVVLTSFEGFAPAIGVALFVLALQQFDGLILGPKILGESIGITPFWIISAITVGGALWGPLGMFFASPILAVILTTINSWLDQRLSKKEIVIPKLSPDKIIPSISQPNINFNFFKQKKKP